MITCESFRGVQDLSRKPVQPTRIAVLSAGFMSLCSLNVSEHNTLAVNSTLKIIHIEILDFAQARPANP